MDKLGINDGVFIGVRQVDLEKHEACAVSISLMEAFVKSLFELITNESPFLPVLSSYVVTSCLENQVGGNPDEELFVVSAY